MRSRKQFSSTLLIVGMVAMLSFSWLPTMRTEEVLGQLPDNFGMFSFSWLPTMRTEEVLAAPEEVLAALRQIWNRGNLPNSK